MDELQLQPECSSERVDVRNDGGTCKVCGDKATAIHYGVLACQGCKSFFARALPSHPSYTCPSKNCMITKDTRNRCMYCRWKKCLTVGMSKDSVKLGRRSKNMKTKLATQNTSDTPGTPPRKISIKDEFPPFPGELNPSSSSTDAASAFAMMFPGDHHHVDHHHGIPPAEQAIATAAAQAGAATSLEEVAHLESIGKLTYDAFMSSFTFPCTHGHTAAESVTDFNSVLKGHYIRFDEAARSQFQGSPDQMYGMIFSRVTEIIEKVVKFCKAVPGFKDISMEDQMEVLKGATFEIVALRAAFFIENGCLVFFGDPHCVMSFDMLAGTPLEKLFRDIERISTRLLSLNITMTEFSLVCGILVFSAGRIGLKERTKIEEQQLLYSKALRHQLRKTHPQDHDDVFASLMLLLPHIREINCQHSNAVWNISNLQPGQGPTIPPLYREVFEEEQE